MDRRTQTLRRWLTAQTEHEATEAVIALAMEEVTTRRTDLDRKGYGDEDETGEEE
jgi:hypothetical protein